ncbi:hypothetical protein ACFO4E_19780 [Nocardiopsis mangrovi]|uniref:Uncharacterized protein n=1 Tax=Nocardiopsis mangrovi TaxID=1179818 RepID=A0ABV9E1M1_9ACTN
MRPIATALAAIAAAGMCAGAGPASAAERDVAANPAPDAGCIDRSVMPASKISLMSRPIIGTAKGTLTALPACDGPAPSAG